MSIITSTAPASASVAAARIAGSGSAASQPAGDEAEKTSPSVTLTLSDYARKRMKSMREATAKLRAMQRNRQEARKDAARQRLEDIKQRIEMLKQLVAALGPEAAKGMLRQIKQLAQELGQAASVLKEGSGGGAASVNAGGPGSRAALPTALRQPKRLMRWMRPARCRRTSTPIPRPYRLPPPLVNKSLPRMAPRRTRPMATSNREATCSVLAASGTTSSAAPMPRS
ncbi:hypothetical protein SAMN05216588_110127 [Pseudomonas flavescens]|uniref:Uncharacterized protein n=1 Tax=Phytopseudomonas flavescens TaxID=29435 RepID=A0A1G8HAI0_9GAMM|nr:hypothetical protein [Pseudomonas flavescens]SDI03674.1 hypothetical protein SAMN05216588_110127 [Pseudomonas flavescens]